VGNVTTVSVVLDNTAPVVTITNPVDGDYLFSSSQIVQWSINELNLLTGVTCAVNGNSHNLGPNEIEDTVLLASGVNVIGVSATDQAGNVGSTSIQVTLDVDTDGDGIGDYYDTDDDNDNMPDSWELANGLDPLDPLDARLDDDGDGHANLTEFIAGTDPLSSASSPTVTLQVNHITVTDVTPDGFSVIWQATEPSSGNLDVFDDTGTLLQNLNVVSESALHFPAEDIGVMKVTVSGLTADTIYQFQTITTSKANSLPLFSPAYPSVMQVVTESSNTTVVNDAITQKIIDEAGYAADGSLLVVSAEGGDYPVAAWVGHNIASPWAKANLNLIYSWLTHENLQLSGGEELTLWSFGGQLGNYVNIQKVPPLTGTDQTALSDTANLSTQSGYSLDLEIDLNLFALPVYSTPAMTAHSLLLYLKAQAGGDPSVVENIKHYDKQTGSWKTASWFLGQPAGEDFPIQAGEAYLVYMKQNMNSLWFEGIAHGAAIDLATGLNLVSLPVPVGQQPFDYTSYQMLADLGDDIQVSSIKRYDSTQGWQTTSWFFGVPSGVDYSTRRGEGYLIYMNQEQLDWRPPY
jgi:hypothetical protein